VRTCSGAIPLGIWLRIGPGVSPFNVFVLPTKTAENRATLEKLHKRRLLLAVALACLGFITFLGLGAFQTWRNIPTAYAAWDTGTLLVEYLKAHDDQWPKSWDDLLTVMDGKTTSDFILRGRYGLDKTYAISLRERVSVDWNFDPKTGRPDRPVRRLDGKPFPIIWQGAEPNQMVREHLNARSKPPQN